MNTQKSSTEEETMEKALHLSPTMDKETNYHSQNKQKLISVLKTTNICVVFAFIREIEITVKINIILSQLTIKIFQLCVITETNYKVIQGLVISLWIVNMKSLYSKVKVGQPMLAICQRNTDNSTNLCE